MDLKIMVFCVFLHYHNICLCLKRENANINTTHWTGINDQEQTDRKTLMYIQNVHQSIGKRLDEKFQFLTHGHVCRTQPETKKIICEELLQFAKTGFTFGPSSPLKCKKKPYTIQLPTLSISNESRLSLFTCPQVLYTDLETGELKALPYTYMVSKAKTYNSAVLFIQKDSESNVLYPQTYVYIQNIFFKEVEPLAESNSLTLIESTKTELSHDNTIAAYLQQKHTNIPYNKFKQFFTSINACGLRRAHKIYLCKQGIQEATKFTFTSLDLIGYDEARCRKYRVRQSKASEDTENNLQLRNELYMVRCPPLKLEYLLPTLRSINLYYVSSNLSHHSITLFARDNDKKEIPKQEFSINGLKMQPIFQHIHRERFLPIPLKRDVENIWPQKSYQQIEDDINSLSGDVQNPSTLEKMINLKSIGISGDGELLESTTDRWLSDHVLISFSKVKMTKSIYRRFMVTYKSIDICHLNSSEKIMLCNAALHYSRFSEKRFIFTKNRRSRCLRRKVTLTALEADNFQTDRFSMWKCNSGGIDDYGNLYFIGKNHLKDSAIIYKAIKLGGKEYYHPHTLVTTIDRNKLSSRNLFYESL